MNKVNPLVSVLMPAYNAERFITRAIESILNQSYKSIELLIIDDCSTDRTLEIIKKYTIDERLKLFTNKLNLGYLHSTNYLFEKCSGEFITFLDADDFCPDNRILKQINFLNDFKEISCVGSYVQRIDENDNLAELLIFKTLPDDIYNALPNEYHFVGSAMMIRRKVLEEVGGFDSAFDRIGSEDLFWLSKIALKYKISNINEVLYYYRKSDNSISNLNKKSIEGKYSKELAQIAFLQMRDFNFNIFSNANKSILKDIIRFLKMKHCFWNEKYTKGFFYGIYGLLLSKYSKTEHVKYLRIYFFKFLKIKFFLNKSNLKL